MRNQKGLGLGQLMVWGIVIAFLAIGGMKIVPAYIEYGKILKSSRSAVAQSPSGATVADVRKSYSKFAEVENLAFSANDLEISKEGSQIVVSFAYEKRIPLIRNISLVIDFKGSTAGN